MSHSVPLRGWTHISGKANELAADISCAQTLAHLDELSGQIVACNAAAVLSDDAAELLFEQVELRRIALALDPMQSLPCPDSLPLLRKVVDAETVSPVPVRSQSWKKGKEGSCYWRTINEHEARTMMQAARRLEGTRNQGKRCGPLGPVALEILQLFLNMAKACMGRLEPGLNWIAFKLKRSKAAVVAALAALRQYGFLDWRRRYEPTGIEGCGPHVKQATNAYRLIPEMAARILKRLQDAFAYTPRPEDNQQSHETPTKPASSSGNQRESNQQSQTYSLFSFLNVLENGRPIRQPDNGPLGCFQQFAGRKPSSG
ncbi:hypothetical protein [Brucella pituitosa]|uniref:hypothetical protein n=1 Tax=Brucella pituitosa TaxID=571256 RepID=UPI0009A213E4|nr:hypothetical protein [Brucella pituitosa]